MMSFVSFAQDDIPVCEEFPNFHPRCYVRQQNYLVYYIFDSQESGPAADSVWVINASHEVVMTIHAKQGELVDISSLPRGYYVCYVQYRDCIGSYVFLKRTNSMADALEETPTQTLPCKILRDGHLYIKRGEKEYTITGQEVR